MKFAEINTNDESIVRKAGRGIIWNFITFALGKLSVFLTTAILARLLTKNDFGLVSIAIIAINYLGIVKDLGLGVALIQRRNDIERASNTVFTVNIIFGILLTSISYFIAPLVSIYFNEPNVIPVLRWLGLSFVINALSSTHAVLLMREMNYKRKFIPDIGNSLFKTIVSISLAFAGFGVWALVFGQLLGSFVSAILYWLITPWKPKFFWEVGIIKSLLNFGTAVTIGDVLGVIVDNLDYVIVGKMFGTEQLSTYQLAYRLPEVLLIGNLWVMAGVTYPAFSSMQHKMEDLRQAFLMSIRYIQMLALPIAVGLFITADQVVYVFFGSNWLEIIPILRVLSIYALIYSFSYHVGDIYKAIGKPNLLIFLSLAHLAVLIPSMMIGAHYYGTIGVAYGHVFSMLFKRIIGLMVATRFVKVNLIEILYQYQPSLLGILAMVPIVILSGYLSEQLGVYLQLTVAIIMGCISYMYVIWKIEKTNFMYLVNKIFINN